MSPDSHRIRNREEKAPIQCSAFSVENILEKNSEKDDERSDDEERSEHSLNGEKIWNESLPWIQSAGYTTEGK